MAKYLPSSIYWVLSIEAQNLIVPLPPSDFATRVQTMSQPLTTSCLLCNINCSLSFFVVTCKTICQITWETCFLSVFSLVPNHIAIISIWKPVFSQCFCHVQNCLSVTSKTCPYTNYFSNVIYMLKLFCFFPIPNNSNVVVSCSFCLCRKSPSTLKI